MYIDAVSDGLQSQERGFGVTFSFVDAMLILVDVRSLVYEAGTQGK